MTEASDYFLTDKQLLDRFEERVKEFVFGGYSPQAEPVLILAGGQPAAGKSQAMAAIQQRHGQGVAVPLTGDELRGFHPRYQELLRESPQVLESATAQASGPWVRMSIDFARDNGYTLILEGVFRDPNMTLGTAREFAAVRFGVEMVALAVREERSRLDALHRFLNPGTGLPGRWTPPELQDLAYRMTPQTVAAAEADAAVRQITVTNRTGVDLYVNERRADGAWSTPAAAVEAIHDERALPLAREEARGWLDRYREVIITFAVEGRVNDASSGVLQRLTQDADTVVQMVDHDPRSPLRTGHQASQTLLRQLATVPMANRGQALPLHLLPDHEITDRSETQRRRQLTPEQRLAEDSIRHQVRERLSAQHSTPGEQRTAGQGPRVSSTAARSRSTTTRQVPPQSGVGGTEQPPHLRRPGNEQERGHRPSR
ncbi:zeta toxin family protein [Wenjunlia tyrosinilytica]|uniref:UDP-N-acetylglucosamine kinase n=1 Tax=Wenjunlia tyrosinilytica TaxID=1544741 RepID=A0A917ZWQ1_9ACTN|nr:zeta toxin family protein [Wenjunlia tyrosinilytica]GGO98282.1 hypothetical protein GCM10012280_62040 [Wenjunlia tyrosinilytica]